MKLTYEQTYQALVKFYFPNKHKEIKQRIDKLEHLVKQQPINIEQIKEYYFNTEKELISKYNINPDDYQACCFAKGISFSDKHLELANYMFNVVVPMCIFGSLLKLGTDKKKQIILINLYFDFLEKNKSTIFGTYQKFGGLSSFLNVTTLYLRDYFGGRLSYILGKRDIAADIRKRKQNKYNSP